MGFRFLDNTQIVVDSLAENFYYYEREKVSVIKKYSSFKDFPEETKDKVLKFRYYFERFLVRGESSSLPENLVPVRVP